MWRWSRRFLIGAGIAGGTAIAVLVGLSALYEHLLYVHVYDRNPDYQYIDSCIDNGGAWDHQARRCDGARRPLPPPPTRDRD